MCLEQVREGEAGTTAGVVKDQVREVLQAIVMTSVSSELRSCWMVFIRAMAGCDVCFNGNTLGTLQTPVSLLLLPLEHL